MLQLYSFVDSFGYSLRVRHATSNATAEISYLATQREVDGVRPSRSSCIGDAARHGTMAIRVREEHTLLTVEEPHLLLSVSRNQTLGSKAYILLAESATMEAAKRIPPRPFVLLLLHVTHAW